MRPIQTSALVPNTGLTPNMHVLTVAVVIAWMIGLASSASAATVLIDWSRGSGLSGHWSAGLYPGDTDGEGRRWNSLGEEGDTDLATTSLNATDGAATGWSVAVTNPAGAYFSGRHWGVAGDDPFDDAPVRIDGIRQPQSTTLPTIITFTGLTAGMQYDFLAMGSTEVGWKNDLDGEIDVTTGTSADLPGTLLLEGTVLDFSVTPDVTGKIVLTFINLDHRTLDWVTSGIANFNGLSVTEGAAIPEPAAVPEPSTFAIATLALIGLAFLGRRKRR